MHVLSNYIKKIGSKYIDNVAQCARSSSHEEIHYVDILYEPF